MIDIEDLVQDEYSEELETDNNNTIISEEINSLETDTVIESGSFNSNSTEDIDSIELEDIDTNDSEESNDINNVNSDMLEDIDKTEDINSSALIRDLLNENVSPQILPSDNRVLWSDINKKGNCECQLRDDAEIKVYHKADGEYELITGKDFNEQMKEKYGVDYVSYSHKEPDFTPFEHHINQSEFESFLESKYGMDIKIDGVPEGSIKLDNIESDRNKTFQDAYQYYLDVMGNNISLQDLKDYVRQNNLTWHECGDRKTIQLVPAEINQIFSHTGGIGIQDDFEVMQETVFERIESNGNDKKLELIKEEKGGLAKSFDEAILESSKEYHERKRG